MFDFGSISVWLLVLAGCIVVCFVLAIIIRRKLFKADEFPKDGFTIGQLRQLHQSGQMSDEEFEKAKTALLGALNRRQPPRENSRK